MRGLGVGLYVFYDLPPLEMVSGHTKRRYWANSYMTHWRVGALEGEEGVNTPTFCIQNKKSEASDKYFDITMKHNSNYAFYFCNYQKC